MSTRGNKFQPQGTRKRIQGITVSGAIPSNLPTVVGIRFTEADATMPPNLQQVSSATYSLGSPAINGMQRVALLSYSLASPNLPTGLKRVAVLPDP